MAAPSYTTDLILIHDCQTATGWAEPTATGWTSINSVTGGETDYYIQGSACNSATVKSGVGGLLYDATSLTIPTDGAILLWLKWDAPNCLYTETNGGIRFVVGSALNAFYGWKIGGVDTYTYGGWINIACDPSQTPDYTVGSPTSTRRYLGWAYNATTGVPTKGNPYGVDCVRYGRCESRLSGGDLANGYATFDGFSAVNDLQINRWGLLQAVNGSYLSKGLIIFGYGSAVDFRDSNKNIIIDNTRRVSSNFNGFEVRQSTSRIDLTAITISALGTASPGNWVTTDNATQNILSCFFINMGTFGFASNSTITNTTFRSCKLITQNSSIFSKCIFDSTTDTVKTLLSNNPSNISNCTFISSGTKHAIELSSSCAGNTYNFTGNSFTNYATVNGSTGNEVLYNNSGGTVTLNVSNVTGVLSVRNGTNATTILLTASVTTIIKVIDIITGYASSSGSTGNEVLYNNSGGTVILNVSNITGTLSIRNGTNATTILSTASVTTTIKVIDAVTLSNIQSARVLVLAYTGGSLPYNVTVTISRTSTTATVTHTSHGYSTGAKVQISGATQPEYNGIKTITYISANSYSFTISDAVSTPATGTIKATTVIIEGETDSNGLISDSRSLISDQPITGRVRKSVLGSYYKTSPINGTISSSNGFTTTVQLIPD